jgi:uncharacterized protein (TIGR03905 family)
MTYTYKTKGTCSTNIELEVEDGIVRNIAFWGGCNGNLQGLSRLVAGMPVKEVISRLEGIRCGGRPTSCPDQLCKALHEMGIDSAALIEDVRGRDDFLGTDYADFTDLRICGLHGKEIRKSCVFRTSIFIPRGG